MRDNNNSYNKEIFNNLKILKMNIKIWIKKKNYKESFDFKDSKNYSFQKEGLNL